MMKKTAADIEPWVVVVDDLEGGFELVYWCTDAQEAYDFYASLQNRDYTPDPTYQDKEGRNAHIFQMIATSDEVLRPGIPDSLPDLFSSIDSDKEWDDSLKKFRAKELEKARKKGYVIPANSDKERI